MILAYQIEVVTSDIPEAGTQHNAWLVLAGDLTESEEFIMENTARRKILRRCEIFIFIAPFTNKYCFFFVQSEFRS